MGNEYKICYYCGEKIQVYARRCDYCGSLLKPELNRIHNPAFSNELKISDESSNQLKEYDGSNENSNLDSDNKIYESSEESNENKVNEFNNDIVNQFNFDNNKVERAENITDLCVRFYPGTYVKNRLSNGLKVFITVISSVIPGIGQLIGVIISIAFINSDDQDMRSFGTALLVSSMVLFVITCILFFITLLSIHYIWQM